MKNVSNDKFDSLFEAELKIGKNYRVHKVSQYSTILDDHRTANAILFPAIESVIATAYNSHPSPGLISSKRFRRRFGADSCFVAREITFAWLAARPHTLRSPRNHRDKFVSRHRGPRHRAAIKPSGEEGPSI